VQLLGRDDIEPPDHGSVRLADSETGEVTELYIDSAVKQRYRDNLVRVQQSWDDACRQCGAQLTTVVAEELGDSLAKLEAMQLLAPA
jgi:hypothetical protein